MRKRRTMWVCELWNDYEPGEVFAVAPDERTALIWLERKRDAEVRLANKNRRELAEPGEKVDRMRKDEAAIYASGDRWSFRIGPQTWVVREHPLLTATPSPETDR
jgi:hypothetical protein